MKILVSPVKQVVYDFIFQKRYTRLVDFNASTVDTYFVTSILPQGYILAIINAFLD